MKSLKLLPISCYQWGHSKSILYTVKSIRHSHLVIVVVVVVVLPHSLGRFVLPWGGHVWGQKAEGAKDLSVFFSLVNWWFTPSLHAWHLEILELTKFEGSIELSRVPIVLFASCYNIQEQGQVKRRLGPLQTIRPDLKTNKEQFTPNWNVPRQPTEYLQ